MKYTIILIIIGSLSSCLSEKKETIDTHEFKNNLENIVFEAPNQIEEQINHLMDSIELYEKGEIDNIPTFLSNENLDGDLMYGGFQHVEVSYREEVISSITNISMLTELSEDTVYSKLPDTSGLNIKFMPNWDLSNRDLAKLRLEYLTK